MFDKNDTDLCRSIWDMHKDKVMKEWRRDARANAGKRPYLRWKFEATEPKIESETELKYLKRLGLLEDWEIKELERIL